MTEKQGGSDVRANATRADPVAGTDDEYELTGHKWFCSAPMCDLFLVLAQAPGGPTCFAVPRWLPDGTRNRFFIQRLKDKLGNRSNASSEIELDRAWGRRVGDEGRGVATIIAMVNHTRLDCVVGSAAVMRQALTQASHHTAHRSAFGRRLAEQPLMTNVLADLAVESEAATLTMLRLAAAYDHGDGADEAQFRRLATAVAKYWICKRQPAMVGEALECLGGNGYVEESGMPRLFRESPLNGIWEGSGNVICLDVLHTIARDQEAAEVLLEEVETARGGNPRLDLAIERLSSSIRRLSSEEVHARRLVELIAVVLQGALLVKYGPDAVADAYCASRLTDDWCRTYGTLPSGVAFDDLIKLGQIAAPIK
jgi:putative acyl-CoA dehydrogenase